MGVGKLGRTGADVSGEVLAGAVAHDLNNALTGIFGGLDFARCSLAAGRTDRLENDLEQIREGAERLLALSRLLEARAGGQLPSQRPAAAPMGPVRRGRLLVIEDEPTLVELVEHALAGAHDVVACASPVEALARVAAGEEFDAVLCDMMLPDMDGPAVYEALHAIAPGLAERVVFMTGGAFTPRTRAFLAGYPGARLEKPFGMLALREVVAEVVARAQAAAAV